MTGQMGTGRRQFILEAEMGFRNPISALGSSLLSRLAGPKRAAGGRRVRLIVFAAIGSLLLSSSAVRATVITFEDLPDFSGIITSIGPTYSSGGFQFATPSSFSYEG